MNEASIRELEALSKEARRLVVRMIGSIGVGHVGGSLSIIEALVYLYYKELRVRPEDPRWVDRDRFVLSKGHAGPALYTLLAMKGYFDKELLSTLNQPGTLLPSHCDMKRTTGVDMTAGSLGQGLSAAVGMALSARMDRKDYRVYCLIGDGEQQEGQVWEAAMSAAKYHLDNLCAVVDVNGLQIDGATKDVMPSEPLDQKFAAFNWNVIHVNGHDYDALIAAFEAAAACKGKPTVLIAKTTKGKGVSFMENNAGWHGKAPNDEQYAQAKAEVEAKFAELEGK